jgi:RecG-like helicase
MSPLFRRDGDKEAGSNGGSAGVIPIGSVTWRQRAKVRGRVKSVRVQPFAGVPTLECTVYDDTGGLAVVFLGRREIPGIRPGSTLVAEGMVSEHQGRLAILNPAYQLLPTGEH